MPNYKMRAGLEGGAVKGGRRGWIAGRWKGGWMACLEDFEVRAAEDAVEHAHACGGLMCLGPWMMCAVPESRVFAWGRARDQNWRCWIGAQETEPS